VVVDTPPAFRGRSAEFVAEVESLAVQADGTPRIVVNERTGTITLGKEIRIRPVAILHGNLSVEVRTTLNVSQPAPMAQGETAVVPNVDVAVKEDKARSVVLREGATVEDLVRGLTSLGSTPRDVIAVLQTLRAAGALEADLEVI
jgi:flagellar P-ring protein precursor FlgI